jgi:hypothetical protein
MAQIDDMMVKVEKARSGSEGIMISPRQMLDDEGGEIYSQSTYQEASSRAPSILS